MKLFLSKIIRKLIKSLSFLKNIFKILSIKLKYPNVSISFSTRLQKGSTIRCTDNSKIDICNSTIESGTLIVADHGGFVSIKDSYIGRNSVIVSRKSITIKSNCQIAEMVVIRDQNHNFGKSGLTISEQGFTISSIIIGKNVWLGTKSTILAGTIIGNNTVVGANAVVRGELDSNAVYVGVPAKKIRKF